MNDNTFLEQDNRKLAKLERRIHSAMCSFVDAGEAFATIRDDPARLYAKHGTFEEYCRDRWNLGRAYVYKLINAAKVARSLEQAPVPKLEYEAQARQLVSLTPKQQLAVWTRANEIAKANGKPLATSTEIRKARSEISPPKSTEMSPRGDISVPKRGKIPPALRDKRAAASRANTQCDSAITAADPQFALQDSHPLSPRVYDPGNDSSATHDKPTEDAPHDLAEDLNSLKAPPDKISQTWNGAEMDWEISEVEHLLARFTGAHEVEKSTEHLDFQACVARLKSAWEALKRCAARAAANRDNSR